MLNFFELTFATIFPFGFLTRNRKLFNASFPERMHIKKNKLKKKYVCIFMNVFPLKLRQLLKVSFFSFIYLIFFLVIVCTNILYKSQVVIATLFFCLSLQKHCMHSNASISFILTYKQWRIKALSNGKSTRRIICDTTAVNLFGNPIL